MGLINVPTVNTNDAINKELFNSRFGEISDEINGNLDSNNISAGGINTANLADNAVTAAKIEDQEAWTEVTYSNSWVAYDVTPFKGWYYMKDSLGFVHLKGLGKNGSATNAVMFTLPSGYRPEERQAHASYSDAGACRIDIRTNGEVYAPIGGSTTYTSLSGITFKAA